MTVASIARLLRAALPKLSFRARAILDALLLSGGSIGTAEELAPHLGLRSRFQLARLLRQEGLPPLHELAAWARLLSWVHRAEATDCSLCQVAFESRRDPSACYRDVKRLTGRYWSEIRRRGWQGLIADFLGHCRTPVPKTDRSMTRRRSGGLGRLSALKLP